MIYFICLLTGMFFIYLITGNPLIGTPIKSGAKLIHPTYAKGKIVTGKRNY